MENVKSMRKELMSFTKCCISPIPNRLLDEQIYNITYMPKEAREETMVKKKWRDDRRKKEMPGWNEVSGYHFIFSLWSSFFYFIALTFSPKNNMWVLTICMSLSTQWQTTNLELQKQPFRPGVPMKSCITWQDSRRVGGHLVNPHVLFYAQVPNFCHSASACMSPSSSRWRTHVLTVLLLIIRCFFINLYINLKA